jgi:hypothetical protein
MDPVESAGDRGTGASNSCWVWRDHREALPVCGRADRITSH